MPAARPVTLAPWPPAAVAAAPAPVTLARPPQGPKEQGLALRLALRWAVQTSPAWAEQAGGLRLVLVTPSLVRARLEGATRTGGTVLIRLEGRRLHLLRIELGWSLTLTAELPDRLAVG